MALFKNGVGRPSNELIRKRRTAYLIIAGAILLLIGGGVFYVKKQFSGEIGSKSKNAASSCAQPYSIAACENEGYYERAHGDSIQKLQEMLQEAGYHYGYVNGNYGSYTVDAVKKAQKALGLQETGLADYNLVEKLAPKYKYGYTIITYNANGATGKVLGTVDNKEFIMRANTPISSTKLVKNGNTHIGWIATSVSRTNNTPYYYGCDKKNCTKPTMYTEDQKISLGTKFVPYVFTPGEKVHSDTFNGKDGVNVKLSAYFCSATGATYNKNTSSCSKGTAGNGYTYTATFVLNGAKSISTEILGCDVSASNKSEGCKITLPSIVAKPNGTVLGWSKRRYASGGEFRVGETVTLKKNETYYAITKRTITAKFDKNNAQSISTTKASCVLYNNEHSCNIITPKITAKTGYSVVGWARNKTGWETAIFNANSSVNLTGDTTFYALANNLYTRFPDAEFRRCILNNTAAVNAKKVDLSMKELADVYQITCRDIEDFSGLQYLTGLEIFWCTSKAETLDLSKNTKLKDFRSIDSNLKNLNVSNNKELERLNLSNSKITTLNVRNNTKLKELSLYENQLTSIDLSKNLLLEDLSVGKNSIAILDLGKNSKLKHISASANQLTSIIVNNHPNLKELYVFDNKLTSLNVGKSTNLQILRADKNKLKSIDVTKNSKLTKLWLYENELTSLNINGNPLIKDLDISKNKLKSLNISKQSNLERFDARENNLTSLVTGKSDKLYEFKVNNNSLAKIDVTGYPNITTLYVSQNKLDSLNVTYNKKLMDLSCYSNQLTSINLEKNKELTSLYIGNNKLESINVKNNTELLYFGAYDNKLKSLNLENNKKLIDLTLYNNELTDLNLTQNPNLIYLSANKNKLTNINLTKNSKLKKLNLEDNKFVSINLKQNKALTDLNINNNELKSIDLSANVNLDRLDISNSTLKKLDVTKNKKLRLLNIFATTELIKKSDQKIGITWRGTGKQKITIN